MGHITRKENLNRLEGQEEDKEKEMPGILKQLKELEVEKSPFINKILDTKGAAIHYVKPKLVDGRKSSTQFSL